MNQEARLQNVPGFLLGARGAVCDRNPVWRTQSFLELFLLRWQMGQPGRI